MTIARPLERVSRSRKMVVHVDGARLAWRRRCARPPRRCSRRRGTRPRARPRSGRRWSASRPSAARSSRDRRGPRRRDQVLGEAVPLDAALVHLGRAVAGEEDQHRVVLLGRAGEEGAERPLDVAQGGLALGVVGEQEHVVLLEAGRADERLVDRLGVGHRVAQARHRRVLVAADADDDRPLGGRAARRAAPGARPPGRRAWRAPGSPCATSWRAAPSGSRAVITMAFAPSRSVSGARHHHRLLRAPLRLLMHLGPVQRHRDPADALARAHHRREHAGLVGHAGAILAGSARPPRADISFSWWIVRISCMEAPARSRAVTTMTFMPSRRVSAAESVAWARGSAPRA